MWKRRPGSGLLVQRVPAHLAGMGRHANEFVVTTILDEVAKLTGKPVRARRVLYEHARGAPGVDYTALHAAERVEFDAGMTGVELSDETLARPISSSSPALLETLRRAAMQDIGAIVARVPRESSHTGSTLSRISEIVRLGLSDGVPTLPSLARSMSMSPRSLQRCLAAAGTSLRQLVERVRMAEAERRLVTEQVDVATLARELGFADPSAFGRAFRRWSGESATAFRGSRATARRRAR